MNVCRCCGTESRDSRAAENSATGLSALVQNALPNAVDGLLELRSGPGSNLVQVWPRRTAHNQDVLLRHVSHDRIAIEQLDRLADRSNSRLDLRAETTAAVQGGWSSASSQAVSILPGLKSTPLSRKPDFRDALSAVCAKASTGRSRGNYAPGGLPELY